MNKQIDKTVDEDPRPQNRVNARCLGELERLEVLPALFGSHAVRFEMYVFGWMRRLAPDYDGAHWGMYRLSNGGFYMAPTSKPTYVLSVDTNQFEGTLCADAAGIVATLFALNQLTWEFQDASFADLYHSLLDFAAEHAEFSLIYRAID